MAKKKLTWQVFDKLPEDKKALINDQIVKDSPHVLKVSRSGWAFGMDLKKWEDVDLIRWQDDRWIVTIIDYDVYAKWYIPNGYQIDENLLK